MNLGIDVGYSAVKIVAGPQRRTTFPSVVGTPEKGRFALNGSKGNNIVLETDYGTKQVGEGAVLQSRFQERPEDRAWIDSNAYRYLMLAAFTEMTTATSCDLAVVTGLPVAFYSDRDALRDRFLGVHRVAREGRRAQLFRVTDARVIPQPFGALLAETLNDHGKVVDQSLAAGSVGIIDVGGKTCNLLRVNELAEVGRETSSVSVGAWDAARALKEHLAEHYPKLDLRDHQIIDAIIKRKVGYCGESVDLGAVVDAILEPMADQVMAQAGQLWNGGAALDAILVAGGGALLLGPFLRRRFPHLRVVDNPVYANALGYWRFAQMLG